MKDFNLAKYLKEHNLGSHGILGKYVDLESLKEESEVPYEGPDPKLDGFGDKFKQAEPVSEIDGPWGTPPTDEENPWMEDVDGTDAYKVGNWTCYYDFPGILVWSYNKVPFDKLAVYATPNWDNDGTTPIQIDIDEKTQDQMTLKQGSFADFNEYATAMKPYLDRIEDLESNWGSLGELEKPDNIYDDEDEEGEESPWAGRIFDLGGAEIEQGIISLLDDGFEPQDILDWVKVVLEDQAEARAQGKKF